MMYLVHSENCFVLIFLIFADNNMISHYFRHNFDSQNFIMYCVYEREVKWIFLRHVVRH